MKNIVNVLRLRDNAKRLYILPDDVQVAKGTVVMVEFAGGKTLGVAITDNKVMDDEQEALIREFLHINPAATEYAKVTEILTENPVAWPEEPADDDADTDADEAGDGEDEDK